MTAETATPSPVNQALKDHYSRQDVLYEMAKASAWRECVALSDEGGLRPLKMYRAKDVEFWLSRIRPWQRPTDFYHSIVKVDLPPCPANLSDMKAMQKHLMGAWASIVRGYSWFIDIDVYTREVAPGVHDFSMEALQENFDAGRDAAVRAVNASRDMGLATYPVFSGSGWNVRLDDFEFSGPPGLAPDAMRGLAGEVAAAARIPFLNPKREKTAQQVVVADNTIYDLRRINRIPFTVSRKTGLVVTPLTLGEAVACRLEWFTMDRYAERFTVRDRLAAVREDARVGSS